MHIHLNRRDFLGATSAAGLATGLGMRVASASPREDAPFRRCIMLWMEGGPSQLETIDPKPGTAIGGPTQSVDTAVSDLMFSEHLAGLAKHSDDLCVIRNVTSKQGEHVRATHLLHTGFEPVASFPRPSVGAYVAERAGETRIPAFVTLGGQGFGPAFLGESNGPFVIDDLGDALERLERVQKRSDRLGLIEEINRLSPALRGQSVVRTREAAIESVRQLVSTSFAKALDVHFEPQSTWGRYGNETFGQRVLAARRLLESGCRFVEVQMPGWDTHVGNFRRTAGLCAQLEAAWLALMEDLKASGLWNETLVVWMGEFGRTPAINGQAGRDHFPQVIPVVLAGHSVGGNVIGRTGKDGHIVDETNTVPDLMATLLTLLGVDVDEERSTLFGSPTTVTDDGQVIPGVPLG